VEEKRLLAERKNGYYLEMVKGLRPSDVAAGGRELVAGLKGLSDGGVRVGVVSASRNARLVLELLAIEELFDVVIDGGDVTRGKPDPQGFLLAAERMRVSAARCVVVEDADAGIRAGKAAGMKTVGIGEAAMDGDVRAKNIGEVTVMGLEGMVIENAKFETQSTSERGVR
jgi:beta-phosphoglucomutase-like phosphatase (HAD superfamily)